jgi:Flp pilus assembly protein TadG
MKQVVQCRSGSAAAETAMVAPLLIGLLFGSVELGHYFWHEHIVVKAVRDGARFAARQQISNFVTSTSGCLSAPGGVVGTQTKNLVRTGTVASGGSPRISYWTNAGTIDVTVTCSASVGGQNMTGIYNGMNYAGAAVGAPVVTVTALVPYTTLFGMTFGSTYKLRASQQAVVTGV